MGFIRLNSGLIIIWMDDMNISIFKIMKFTGLHYSEV